MDRTFADLLGNLSSSWSSTFMKRIEDDLCNFLKISQERSPTLANGCNIKMHFPPMTSHFRFLIHATADRFGIKSSSVGWGHDRATEVTWVSSAKEPLIKWRDMIPQEESWITLEEFKKVTAYASDFSEPLFEAPTNQSQEVKTETKRTRDDQQSESSLPAEGTQKKIRGRGSSQFNKSTIGGLNMDTPITARVSNEQSTSQVEEDIVVPLKNSYEEYEAAVIRAEEEKKYRKPLVELNKREYVYSSAWCLDSPGEGTIEFQCNKVKEFDGISMCISKSTDPLYEIHYTSKEMKITATLKCHSKALCEKTWACTDEPVRMWVLLRPGVLMCGISKYIENYDVIMERTETKDLRNIGFATMSNAVVRNIHLSSSITPILATRDHILVLQNFSDEKKLYDVVGKSLTSFWKIEGSASSLASFSSVASALKAANLLTEELKINSVPLRMSKFSQFADLPQQTPRTSLSNVTTAKRLISSALK